MKSLLALFLCAQAQAASIPDLELLRSIAADQGVPVMDLPAAPRAAAAPAGRSFEGFVRVVKKSPDWRRPGDALKDRSLILEGAKELNLGSKPWAWIKDDARGRALAPESRSWVKGKFREQGSEKWRLQSRVLEIADSISFPVQKAELLPLRAQNAELSAELVQVSPWCDHMPIMSRGERRQYLVIETRLTNKTDKPLEVALSGVFFSFDAASEGVKVDGLSIRGPNGRGSGQTKITLAPGAALKLELRGDNLYPEGSHGKSLYVTLRLAAGSDSLFVRGFGQVLETQ
ncbi:MAG: hypothetical protein HY077_01165 [Elusimicrobia bacterium]|nr:hypothetical protein [Elusimicrobiota bacterium]